MTGDRAAYLRVQQHYGEMLADFHRKQADLAAEHDAKIARQLHRQQTEDGDEVTPATSASATFDEDDFSNNTWLR